MILSPARRRALEVLAETHPRPGCYSNATLPAVPVSRPSALVYWQSADWLIAAGLAEFYTGGVNKLALTPAGLLACDAAGITVGRAA